MLFSTTILFAALASITGVPFTQAIPVEDYVNTVVLSTPDYTHVQSTSNLTVPYVGYGAAMWQFPFEGTYNTEEFIVTYFQEYPNETEEDWINRGYANEVGTNPTKVSGLFA
jgi:hypothetical protein